MVGIVNDKSRPNGPYPYASLYVCVSGNEPVTIDSLAAARTVGDVSVNRLGIARKPGASFSLAPLRPLSDRYAPAEGYQLDPGCAGGRRYDVGVELVWTTAGDAAMEGIQVTYTVARQVRATPGRSRSCCAIPSARKPPRLGLRLPLKKPGLALRRPVRRSGP